MLNVVKFTMALILLLDFGLFLPGKAVSENSPAEMRILYTGDGFGEILPITK